MLAPALNTARLILRNLTAQDVSDRYLGWLHDKEVTRFLEIRFAHHTHASTADFLEAVNCSEDSLLFGIFLKDGGKHIGNIKLGPINAYHGRADIGLMLGDREEWGQGYASEAIAALAGHAFEQLQLRKVSAGCYEDNVGSLKAFLKAGFTQEARLPNHWSVDGTPQAELLLGLSRQDRAGLNPESLHFDGVEAVTFIGGGELMLACASWAKDLGYRVGVILAPRHAQEACTDSSMTVEAAARARGFNVAVMDNINQGDALGDWPLVGDKALALCFGPAWVFSDSVMSRFGQGMANFNGIPIPHYLGGAHYTWQILHGNRSGGCFLQQITSQIDQGDVLRYQYFDLPPEVRTPGDYFTANFDAAILFLKGVLADMKGGVAFAKTPYESFNARRLYFPRLYTKENAYLDWRWSGEEIERFCNAFDEPYMGAASHWAGHEVRLRAVRFEPSNGPFHPYTSGLVVRRHQGKIWVAVRDGLLALGDVLLESGESATPLIREGDRLMTTDQRIWHGMNFTPRFTGNGLAATVQK